MSFFYGLEFLVQHPRLALLDAFQRLVPRLLVLLKEPLPHFCLRALDEFLEVLRAHRDGTRTSAATTRCGTALFPVVGKFAHRLD